MYSDDENGQRLGEKQERWFRDVSEVIPEFDPVRKNISIIDWIDKVEECGERYNWDDLAIRHYALAKLVGVARRWKDSLKRDDKREWKDWVVLLKKNFPCKKSAMSVQLAAQNYKRKPSQDMTEYFYEKLARCNEAEMSSNECIEWIVHGLNSTHFRDFLGPLDRYSEPFELLPHLEAGSMHIRENASGNASGKNGFEKRVINSKDSTSGEATCFACKETGHWKRDCPNKTKIGKCFKCGVVGHLARDCGKMQPRSGEITSTTASASGSGLRSVNTVGGTHAKYFKNALLNGESLSCYLDLGSSVVAIRACEAARIGLNVVKGKTEALVGYGNGIVCPIGRIVDNLLSIDGVEARVDVHVVPDQDQAVPLLVGHPYTEQQHVVITSTSAWLIIEERRDTLTTEAVSQPMKTVLCAVNTYEVPDNYVGRICVESDFKDSELFVNGDVRESGHLIPRCVLKTDKKGQTVLPVLNLSGAPLKVSVGSVVTRAHKCEEAKVREREINQVPVTREEIDTDLESDQAEMLLALVNEYKDVVARNMAQLGCSNVLEMEIKTEDGTTVFYRPYRLSYSEREQTKDLINELKEADIVEECSSPYASPMLLVTREIRMGARAAEGFRYTKTTVARGASTRDLQTRGRNRVTHGRESGGVGGSFTSETGE